MLKGRVVGADGRPVQGAKVVADNQLLYNSNLIVSTDADGRYRVETDIAATFHVTASMTVEHNGTSYQVDLSPDDDSSFAEPDRCDQGLHLEAHRREGRRPGPLRRVGPVPPGHDRPAEPGSVPGGREGRAHAHAREHAAGRLAGSGHHPQGGPHP
ncbi:carboxypeptidase-like regulatory domain-containing protein [Nonomuraea ferruginea]